MRKDFILKFFQNLKNWQNVNVNAKIVGIGVGKNQNKAFHITSCNKREEKNKSNNNNDNFNIDIEDDVKCILKKSQKMYKQSGCNLLNEPRDNVVKWLDSFDAVITDCDGVLWIYSNVIDGAVDTVNCLKDLGKKVYFCTNNSTKTRAEILQKAHQMGFMITIDEVISTAHSAAAYLRNRDFKKKVYVIGSEGITKELDAVGIEHTLVGPDVMPDNLGNYLSQHFKPDNGIGAVIIGFDEHFSFPKMTKAASYLMDPDCLFIATNTDERFPMPKFIIPGTGSFVRAVQTCAEREPLVIGKPNPGICEWLIKQNEVVPERTLMVGDRCNTDILLGYNCGFQTLLVGTGIHNLNDVEAWKTSGDPELLKLIPDTYLPKLGDLMKFLPPCI